MQDDQRFFSKELPEYSRPDRPVPTKTYQDRIGSENVVQHRKKLKKKEQGSQGFVLPWVPVDTDGMGFLKQLNVTPHKRREEGGDKKQVFFPHAWKRFFVSR
jgi:hypothetical protein